MVAAGFSLRLFAQLYLAQLKSCGYHDLFGQPEGCGYL